MGDLQSDHSPCEHGFTWVTIGDLERELWWEVDSPCWFVLRLMWDSRAGKWGEMTSRFETHPPPDYKEFGS